MMIFFSFEISYFFCWSYFQIEDILVAHFLCGFCVGRLDNLILIDLDSLDERLGGNFTRSRITFGLFPLDMIELC